MKILIVAPYSAIPLGSYVNRFSHLAEKCALRGHETTFVTSRFSHSMKKFHECEAARSVENLEVALIDCRAYRSHVGIGRILNLIDFHRNFDIRFSDIDEFDLVYSAYPPIGHGISIARRRNPEKTKFLVDVQDVWPESFSSVLPSLQRIPSGLLPFSGAANRVYRAADGLLAVSQTYLDRARSVNHDAKSLLAYIGTEFNMIDTVPNQGETVRLFYIGTLSYSYDIETVIKAVHELQSKGLPVELNIFGEGPDRTRLQSLPHSGTTFHGLLPYQAMEAELRFQHIAVNAIRAKAPQSVTNKLCDYLGLGCPLLNSQQGEEVKGLLSKRVHRNYRAGDVNSACAAISEMIESPETRAVWKADPTFSRNVISETIIDFIETL
ncbi:glycosyltransferase [Erythrobacter sp. NFXS35]|uniref:glycosyltransferase n=1 Tax=Erythrobacter sp. NFXS35 TaxID=2818436 RepID=UPI0032DF5A52